MALITRKRKVLEEPLHRAGDPEQAVPEDGPDLAEVARRRLAALPTAELLDQLDVLLDAVSQNARHSYRPPLPPVLVEPDQPMPVPDPEGVALMKVGYLEEAGYAAEAVLVAVELLKERNGDMAG